MNILPYTIANTNDLLTGRGGLVCVAELMRRIGFSSWVERYFPKPGSNRGYGPAEVVTCWMLMLHEGARSLEDVRHLREDKALRKLLGFVCRARTCWETGCGGWAKTRWASRRW